MNESPTTCLLLLDLPQSALCGIDLLSFTTTPRFRGIKNLPPGWHFAFVSSTSSLSVRHGAWLRVSESGSSLPELFVKRWDAGKETFAPEENDAELLRWRANLGSIYREGLTPYRQTASKDAEDPDEEDTSNDWTALTSSLSPALLTRITGSAMPNHWSLTSASSAEKDLDSIPGLSSESSAALNPERALTFLPIDLRRTWREGATGRERTTAAQDRSWALNDIVNNHCAERRKEDILGEMQFCFIMVLTLNNHSCLEQWKRILGLVLTCRDAIPQRPTFFTRFLRLLRLQLRRSADAEGGGLFDLSDSGAPLLKQLVRKFKSNLAQLPGSEAKQDVSDEIEALEDYLKDEYGWDMNESILMSGRVQLEDGEEVELELDRTNRQADDEDEESGEYAPTVVELTEEQRREFGSEPIANGDHLPVRLKRDGGVSQEVQEDSPDEEGNIGDEEENDDPRY